MALAETLALWASRAFTRFNARFMTAMQGRLTWDKRALRQGVCLSASWRHSIPLVSRRSLDILAWISSLTQQNSVRLTPDVPQAAHLAVGALNTLGCIQGHHQCSYERERVLLFTEHERS